MKTTEQQIQRMKELTQRLDAAARAYYQETREIMSNFEYDKLYDELVELEKKTGVTLAGSPTAKVGYEVLSELPKEAHESSMLSLDKTKDPEALREWVGNQKAVMSWKLDGLTIVLTYENGSLVKAVTRGNGEVGEVVTNNARVFKNVPLTIPYKGQLIVRGEAVITYDDFEKINAQIPDENARYKNPRNLCSGSVRQLNNEITAKRNVRFYAYNLIQAAGNDFENSKEKQFLWLKEQGFEVVEYKIVTAEQVKDAIEYFAGAIAANPVPSDGLVVLYDDMEYGRSLGTTAKFPRHSIAFKWADELQETVLKEIEWSPSRTGLINPVAIFEPVELEGTTVSRASVHNISIMRGLELGLGDTIQVYKANMIIPQIAENLTRSGLVEIPAACPTCGGVTEIRRVNDAESLYCTNPECQAKKIKSFTLFVSRDAMNMEGLSEATLEKFIAKGFIHEFADLFQLADYRDEIIEMEGFGEKSFENLMESIERARETTLPKVIYGLGILNVGLSNAKLICKQFDHNVEKLMEATVEDLSSIDGVGIVIAESFVSYFADERRREQFEHLLKHIKLVQEQASEEAQVLAGKVFVITGSVEHFANRNEVKAYIEARGGKVTGSVTGKTDYLINNDVTSNSGKNKKAKELGVPILSEGDFLKLADESV